MKRLPMLFLLFTLSLTVFAVGCGPSLATPTPVPTATPLPTLVPTCIPTPNDFFSNNEGTNRQATILADKIYGDIFIGGLSNKDEARMNNAKSQALQFFTHEVKRWTSASQEFLFQDGSKARIFVTFISPQLVRAAALSHAMIGDIEGHNLNAYTRKGLERLDLRNDYIFLITVQAEPVNNSQETIYLSADFFALKGTSGAPIRHIRHDHFLDTRIELSKRNAAGFVYFPLTQQSGDKCSAVLDEQRDSYIILTIANAQIGNQNQTLTFEIPFISPALFDSEIIPTPIPNIALAPEEFKPSDQLPPIASFSTSPNEFWKAFTRFVWKKFTFDGLASD